MRKWQQLAKFKNHWLCRGSGTFRSPKTCFSTDTSTSNNSSKFCAIGLNINEYPEARSKKRKLILHVGPTNSGKTYSALKALRETDGYGIYLGPLRLLAAEVQSKMLENNVLCNLITGQEKVLISNSMITASTVEVLNLENHYKVAVLDEVQFMADPHRGGAWTRAILGLAADEIHLCGEERCVDVINQIASRTGDIVQVNRYTRLSPLEVSKRTIDILKCIKEHKKAPLESGDCIVAFSRNKLYYIKQYVEQVMKMKCSIIYGALPAAIRRAQADLFNSGENEILVATDAVGLGLNLQIKRIIFSDMVKYNGIEEQPLSNSEIKQIGGRAGRYNPNNLDANSVGQVVAPSRSAKLLVHDALSKDLDPLDHLCTQMTDENLLENVCAKLRPTLDPNKHLFPQIIQGFKDILKASSELEGRDKDTDLNVVTVQYREQLRVLNYIESNCMKGTFCMKPSALIFLLTAPFRENNLLQADNLKAYTMALSAHVSKDDVLKEIEDPFHQVEESVCFEKELEGLQEFEPWNSSKVKTKKKMKSRDKHQQVFASELLELEQEISAIDQELWILNKLRVEEEICDKINQHRDSLVEKFSTQLERNANRKSKNSKITKPWQKRRNKKGLSKEWN